MPDIKPKKKPVIKKGINYSYNAATFLQEHKVPNFHVVGTAQELLDKVVPFEMLGRKFITFDTETHAVDLKNHDIPPNMVRRWVGSGKSASPQDFPFCISVCDGKNSYTLYDTLENGYAEFKKLKPLLEDQSIEKIAHNAKFDMHMIANTGIKIKGKIHDTVVISKLANENRHSFKLMDLAAKLKGGIVKFEYMVDNYKKAHKINDYRKIPRELLSEYANADVWNCYLEFVADYQVLVAEELEPLYENELQLMLALWVMERFGMRSNPNYEKALKDELQTLTDTAEQKIYDMAGSLFNINSGKQLYDVLIKMGVDRRWISMTDKGNPCLDKDALQMLADKHEVEIVKLILEFRKYEKLLGTYAIGIYDQRDSVDKVHGSINQTEATTGRMSITKPALQTLPKKDKRIRKVFIPSEDYELWFMDLDQVEYRGFAHYAKAQSFIEAIKKGHDIHQATGAVIYTVPYEEVTEDQRQRAKTINFGLIYGQGDELTATSLKMSLSEARAFKSKYFAMIPEAKPFIDTVIQVIKVRGYIKNFYGRRRRLKPDEAYKGPNALIQGWAADYIKHKLVRIYKFLLLGGYKTRMLNCIHDELVFEVHKDEKFLIPKLRSLLSEFEQFRAPITAGVEYGNPSWGEKAEPEEVGFDVFTPEEISRIDSVDVFNGSVFEIVRGEYGN